MQKLEVNREVAFGDISTEVSCSTKKKKKMVHVAWKVEEGKKPEIRNRFSALSSCF